MSTAGNTGLTGGYAAGGGRVMQNGRTAMSLVTPTLIAGFVVGLLLLRLLAVLLDRPKRPVRVTARRSRRG
ncbi:hypothetical protein ACFWPH_04520 [Nocardia sp. NPDC058499]|uniref:hypothetical protein n=1 Tax=Nocardia sp. NPDC058499 TaxID=3346530 RepID=UPI00365C2A56